MSHSLINLNDDLRRLKEDGFETDIVGGNYLAIYNVPYVDAHRQIKRGTMISDLSLAGDRTIKPANHVMHFVGDHPCTNAGIEISGIKHTSHPMFISPDLTANHSFSSKPGPNGYDDYYQKVTAYVAILEKYAQAIQPGVSARTFRVIENTDEESPFAYIDSASGRANINAVSAKLKLGRVVIVGLGGTGSYILDLIAKTPVQRIDLYDADTLASHNAFRAPGAVSVEELRQQPKKVDHWKAIYGRMHQGIHAHAVHITAANVHELAGADFVFISIDAGEAKRLIVETLEQAGVPFIDVGMGLSESDGSLFGSLRITTSTPDKRDHVRNKARIPMNGGDGADNIYARNIQVADLNCLNAALAVVRFKKHFGFYADLEQEHFTAYAIDGNHLVNEDAA